MVFSSLLFLFLFLPVVLAAYYAAHWWGPPRLKHLLLTLFSYLFYGWANPLFVVLMFTGTMIDYVAGLLQTGHYRLAAWRGPVPLLVKGGPRTRFQTIAMALSIISNLSLLGFFKYFNFGMDSWNALLRGLGLEAAVCDNFLRITLPLGISFYTFQAMSYAIDVYRGDARAIRSANDFFCFVAMFPQLVAGPIIRFQEVADQLRERSHTCEKFARGVVFLVMGLAKKVLLADPCGAVADRAFTAAGLGAGDAWYGALAYAFQIYFDFSAYSDMAVGLGLMMGFMFAKNFDSPYRSRSVTEFWRHWHLSLSTWLRDYLYLPLGGNRRGVRRTYINLILVMLLGGLWHGAAWNFVVWGGIQGAMLAIERLQGKESIYHRLPVPVRIAITFLIQVVAWVFFRSASIGEAVGYLGAMTGLTAVDPAGRLALGGLHDPYHLGTLALAAGIAFAAPQTWDWSRHLGPAKLAVVLVLAALGLLLLAGTSFHPFIYFIF